MKYIIVECQELELAILFDEILTHADVAAGKKVVSAGFCNRDGLIWGKSVSLNLEPRAEDASIITRAIVRRV